MSQERSKIDSPEWSANSSSRLPDDLSVDATTNVAPFPSIQSDDGDGTGTLGFPVVAIGASEGEADAYAELFRSVAPDTGMSFVLLPRLSGEHVSKLPNVLSGATRMPVVEVADGIRPEPNTVYVLPSNVQAILDAGVFKVEPRTASERLPMTIDHFFRSLAADQKNRAIGVVLSGSDSDGVDGVIGLMSIKAEGGIAIVQDPESARVDDLPRASICPDHVDFVLPPSEIASELSRVARHFFQPSLQLLEQGNLAPGDDPHFRRLLVLLRSVAGIEFRNYKPATLQRRTAHRMILRRIDSLPEYVRLLEESREELRNLHEDVLINVTRFFRDPSVFDALKADILPALFDSRPPDQQVRVWIAGCSSGEEAYSLAICLLEFLAGQPHEPAIQLIGTDASERSIEKARSGIYPESIAKDVSPERLRRFFVKTDKGYQISKRVRDLCIFARQNLCNDPPFSRLDLIACRNVLIYLDRATQGQVISTFHYALRANGCLMLGHSESVNDAAGLFTALDAKSKFYMRIGDGAAHVFRSYPRPILTEAAPVAPASGMRPRTVHFELDLQRAADRVVLARHAPPGVVINEALDVLEVRGRPAPFLAMAPGTASLHLLRMAHADILPVLRDAVRRSIESGGPVVEDIAVHQENGSLTATLEVLPIQLGPGPIRHHMVLFVRPSDAAASFESERAERPQPAADREDLDRELARVRRDLTTTRLYLQALIEERDARNQELTAAYEEIQSSNEELQSTNEELQTAKEELQSANEELQTGNDELRNRNQALLQASNDLSNLLNSVNIPVIMLGSDLTIRQFTPPAERLLRLRAADIGRPIGEIRLNLVLENVEPLLHEVLDSLAVKEFEVQDRSGRWHLLRLRPYRTAENRIEGVVLLLLDIDQMRRAQEALQQTRDFAQTVVESVQVPVVVIDGDLRIRTANAAFRELSGLTSADLEKHAFAELLSILWDWPDLREHLLRLLADPNGEAIEIEHETARPTDRVFRMVARGLRADSEPVVLLVLEDVTAQRQAERLLESDRERLAGQVRSTAEVLGRTREELRALAGSLFTSQENERRRVARELHDDISQKLAILEIEIERLRQSLPADQDRVAMSLEILRERTNALSRDVRSLSHQLHPSALDHFGLARALRTLTEDFGQREGMVATFRSSQVPDNTPQDVATALYRIAQEALRNVGKHAGHTQVKVLLEGTDHGLRLSVRDLGEGFDVEGTARRGLGLVSMEERARLVGGALSVQSELGQGTTITATIPLRAGAVV